MSTPLEDNAPESDSPDPDHVDPEFDPDIPPKDDKTRQFGEDPQELQGDDPASGGS